MGRRGNENGEHPDPRGGAPSRTRAREDQGGAEGAPQEKVGAPDRSHEEDGEQTENGPGEAGEQSPTAVEFSGGTSLAVFRAPRMYEHRRRREDDGRNEADEAVR